MKATTFVIQPPEGGMKGRAVSEFKKRVYWTTEERASIVDAAISTQLERPDLSGLPLLRVAMRVLPLGRRRSVVALTQVPWFESEMKAEVARRRAESERALDPVLPEMARTADEIHAHRERVDLYCDQSEVFYEENLSLLNQVVAMLALVERGLRDLSSRLDAIDLARSRTVAYPDKRRDQNTRNTKRQALA